MSAERIVEIVARVSKGYKADTLYDECVQADEDVRFLLDEVKRLREMCQEAADKMGTTGIEDYDWQKSWIKRSGVDNPIWWQK